MSANRVIASPMNQVSECRHAQCTMSDADHAAEKVAQDGMCISCRAHVEQRKEEEAIASFCWPLRNPVVDWFVSIIAGSEFQFARRMPQNIDETPIALFYTKGPLQIQCHSALTRVTLTKPCAGFPTQPDWVIEFHLSTPVPVILASIKAAVEHEVK